MEKITDCFRTEVSFGLSYANHEWDNSFLEPRAEDFLREVRLQRINPLGIQKRTPYPRMGTKQGESVAFVFENEDFEVRWCHLPKIVYKMILDGLYPDWERVYERIAG